jgi:hypothetical protein
MLQSTTAAQSGKVVKPPRAAPLRRSMPPGQVAFQEVFNRFVRTAGIESSTDLWYSVVELFEMYRQFCQREGYRADKIAWFGVRMSQKGWTSQWRNGAKHFPIRLKTPLVPPSDKKLAPTLKSVPIAAAPSDDSDTDERVKLLIEQNRLIFKRLEVISDRIDQLPNLIRAQLVSLLET